MGLLSSFFDKIADIIWPPRCFACGCDVARQGDVCGACFKGLRFITDPMCACCGHPFSYHMADNSVCAECTRDTPPFDKARSALIYNEASRTMLVPFKNDNVLGAKRFAGWCHMALGDILQDNCLCIPVPLHDMRLRERGYNQAALLARHLSKLGGIPHLLDGLERTRHTPKQRDMTRTQRQKNVRGAFSVKDRHKPLIAERHVILVDDVMTTGATIKACTLALKKAGAKKVSVVTVARVVQNEDDLI